MKEIATISFTDAESGSEALIIVRAKGGLIAVCSSLSDDGDVEVILGLQECKKLVEALNQAALFAETQP